MNQEANSSDKRSLRDRNKLKARLRHRLLRNVRLDQVEADLKQFLSGFGPTLPHRVVLARRVAEHFLEKWKLVRTEVLEDVIERQPEMLGKVLSFVAFELVSEVYPMSLANRI